MSLPLTTVVGGGLAGIAAALDLAEHGYPVRLLEAKRRLGGRTGSFRPAGDQQASSMPIDYCQHVGMGCCHGLLRLIAMLEQESHWQRQETLHFYSADGYQRLSALPLLPAPLHLASWLWKWPKLTMRDRFSVALGMLKIRRLRNLEKLESIPAMEWLESVKQTKGAITQFWSTIIVSALGEELDRVSLASVCKVLQDGFLNKRDAFHLLVPQRPLDQLFNIETLHILEEKGVEVVTGSPVEKIQATPTTRLSTTARNYSVAAGNKTFESDIVIVAVPWHQLRHLQIVGSAEEQESIDLVTARAAKLDSSPISGVHTWWDRPWLNTPHATIVGGLCQWVFPAPQQKQTQLEENYYQIVISASRELPNRRDVDLGELIREDLRQIFPEVQNAKLLRHRVVTDPHAVFSVAPGIQPLRADSRLASGIYLAGDWTNTGWPATMEGAILSGFASSQAVRRLPVS